MISITENLFIPEGEIEEKFIRSSGPGGQKVNKTSTAVQLRFRIDASTVLSDEVKARLYHQARRRITSDGILTIESDTYRTQRQNRDAVREKFSAVIRRALDPPRKRKLTKPTSSARKRRLEDKRFQSRKKHLRRNVTHDE